MCECCSVGCNNNSCNSCQSRCCSGSCCPMPACCQPFLDKLEAAPKYNWLQHCSRNACAKCPKDAVADCECICRRNRHIVEALSCLFNCSMQKMLSVLFELAYQKNKPLKRFPRDRVWEVMEHVKAPYTELNDLEIYDSMYDRCGMPIDPLNYDNIYKVVRLMFLIVILTIDQQKFLLRMLKRLNEHAHCPVDLDRLLKTLEGVEIKELICTIRKQEKLSRKLFTARQCADLCQLYEKVASVNKNAVKHYRKRRKVKRLKEQSEVVAQVRQSQLNRQYCERKPEQRVGEANGSPVVATPRPRSSYGSAKLSTGSASNSHGRGSGTNR